MLNHSAVIAFSGIEQQIISVQLLNTEKEIIPTSSLATPEIDLLVFDFADLVKTH